MWLVAPSVVKSKQAVVGQTARKGRQESGKQK